MSSGETSGVFDHLDLAVSSPRDRRVPARVEQQVAQLYREPLDHDSDVRAPQVNADDVHHRLADLLASDLTVAAQDGVELDLFDEPASEKLQRVAFLRDTHGTHHFPV